MRHGQRPRLLLPLALLSAVALFGAGPPAPAARADRLAAELNRQLLKTAADSGFSGAVLVARGGKVVLHEGYGWADLARTAPVTRETRFYVASITKQFTAAAVLKLEERGRLKLDDPLGKHLPGVPPDKAAVTIHQLLTHTSGLGQDYAADGIRDRAGAVRALLAKPLKSQPGAQFRYSNDGYNLLAVVVEIASGETYESFLRRHLLRPAGMTRTGFWGEAPARGARPVAETLKEIGADVAPPNWGFRGATGMTSTVGDLFKWRRALAAGRVLSKAGVEKLLTPRVETPRGGYGYGWFTSETPRAGRVVWASGAEGFGHNAVIKTYADGTVVVVASNAGAIGGAMARELAAAAVEAVIYGE